MGSASSIPATYDRPAQGVLNLLIVLTTAAIVSRVVARRITGAPFGIDDGCVYLTYVMNLGQIICSLLRSWCDVAASPEDLAFIANAYLADGIFYTLAVVAAKMAVLFLMRRIFTMRDAVFRYIWWTLFIFLCPFWTGAVFGLVGWQMEHAVLGSNIVGRIATPVMGSLNALTDVLVLLLPLRSIRKLQLPYRQKVGVAAVFCISICASFVSILRVIFMTIPQSSTWNVAYQNYTDIILSNVETSTFLICACLLVSRAFFLKLDEIAVRSYHDLTSLLTSRGSGDRNASFNFSSQRTLEGHSDQTLRARMTTNNISRTDEVDIEFIPLKQISTAAREAMGNDKSPWGARNE